MSSETGSPLSSSVGKVITGSVPERSVKYQWPDGVVRSKVTVKYCRFGQYLRVGVPGVCSEESQKRDGSKTLLRVRHVKFGHWDNVMRRAVLRGSQH